MKAVRPTATRTRAKERQPAVASVLDRLIDLDPDRQSDPPAPTGSAIRAARDAVRRDLETLLNTQHDADLPTEELPEIETSLLRFGTPGFHGLMLATRAQQLALAATIRNLIGVFEPRLERVVVELGDPGSEGQRALHLRIKGQLKLGGHAESIAFDTRLDPSTRHFRLEG